MREFCLQLITSLGEFAVIAGGIAWLIRGIINHLLTKDIETYKTKIKFESEKEIEQLKAELRIIAEEHHIRFSNLHERRAEIIAALYSLIVKAEVSLINSELEVNVWEKISNKSLDPIRKARDYFKENELYFSPTLCRIIEELIMIIIDPVLEYESGDFLSLSANEKKQKFKDSLAEAQKLIPKIKKEIETEFRKILGVEKGSLGSV